MTKRKSVISRGKKSQKTGRKKVTPVKRRRKSGNPFEIDKVPTLI